VTKENESHKATDGMEFKIISEQNESELKENTGKDIDGLQSEFDGLKVCLFAIIIINGIIKLIIFYLFVSKCCTWTALL
jgi:hypothetical protein